MSEKIKQYKLIAKWEIRFIGDIEINTTKIVIQTENKYLNAFHNIAENIKTRGKFNKIQLEKNKSLVISNVDDLYLKALEEELLLILNIIWIQ